MQSNIGAVARLSTPINILDPTACDNSDFGQSSPSAGRCTANDKSGAAYSPTTSVPSIVLRRPKMKV